MMPRKRKSKKEKMRAFLALSLTKKVSKFKCLSSMESKLSVCLPKIQTSRNLLNIDPRDTMQTTHGQLMRTSGSMPSEAKVRNWRYRYMSNITPGASDSSYDKTKDKTLPKINHDLLNEKHVVLPAIKVKPPTPLSSTIAGNQSRSPATGGLFPHMSRPPMGSSHQHHSLKVS